MLRWIKRISLGLLVLVVLLVGGTLVFVHTDYGRDKIRGVVESQLQSTFVGGATLGKIEGSPLGELTVHDIVINGPDHRPAFKIGTLHARINLLDLLSHDVRLKELIAEDVDVILKRDPTGKMEVANLVKPGPKTKWNVDLAAIDIRRGHLLIDTGTPDYGTIDLDGLALTGALRVPANGPLSLNLEASGTWRQRGVPIAIAANLRNAPEVISIPTLALHIGGVSLTGSSIEIAPRAGKAPLFGGRLDAVIPHDAAVALGLRVPADLVVAADITRGTPLMSVALSGTVGPTPVRADFVGDLDAMRATGVATTGEIDLATLTNGHVVAIAGGTVAFDIVQGAPGQLPTTTLGITAHGAFEDMIRTDVTGTISTSGDRISTRLEAVGGARATLTAQLAWAPNALRLLAGRLDAHGNPGAGLQPKLLPGDIRTAILGPKPPGRAFASKLDIALSAHGTLTPVPDLAVAGTVGGAGIYMQDISVASVALTVDAASLPAHPRGKAKIVLGGLVRGDVKLGALAVDAATQADGRIALAVQSHPPGDPWLVELNALVAYSNGVIAADLGHHHIRAGNGIDWTGDGGRLDVNAARLALRDLKSTSSQGEIALAGTVSRVTGNLTATIDGQKLALQSLRKPFLGTATAHVEIARTATLWSGSGTLSGKGISLDPRAPIFDVDAKLEAKPGNVTATATVRSKSGNAQLALDIAAPARLEDVASWKHRGRDAIKRADIGLQGVDLAKLDQQLAGQLDANLKLTAATAEGTVRVHHLQAPQLAGISYVDADLALAQPSAGELAPTLTVLIPEFGKLVASGRVTVPARPFDPAGWTLQTIRAAKVDTDAIAIDPSLLDRFGIHSKLRAKARLHGEIADGGRSATLSAELTDLRGTPFAHPVDLHLTAAVDDKGTTATGALASKTATLVKIDAHTPETIDQLRAQLASFTAAPLTATIAFPKTPAAQLLEVFGRNELSGGTLDGQIAITGTLARPAIHGKLTAEQLAMPPGPRGKPVAVIRTLVVDGAWENGAGKIAIDGTQDGGGVLTVRAQGGPSQLATGSATVVAKHFEVAPLLVFAPGPAGAARGTLDADLSVKGFDPRTAQVLGQLHIKDARFPIAPQIGTLRRASIDLVIHPHDIAVTATGKLGKGDIKLDGSIALDGASLSGGKAKLTLRKVSPIGAIEPVIDADVSATLARKDNQWTADLVVDKGVVKVTTTKGEKLKPVGNPPDLAIGRGRTPRKPDLRTAPVVPILIVKLKLGDTRVESDEFRTTIHGALTLTADATDIGIVGSVQATGGDLDLFDRRYQVDHALVSFDGSTDPLLDIRITHDFPDVETITDVRGRLSKPRLEMSASPGAYTQSQLLGFLLGGEPNGDPNSGSARDKATSVGSSLIASQIGGYIKKALPFDLDVIRYEAASVSSSAAITVGSWVTHTLFVAFRQHVAARPDENSGEGTVEYWLTKRLEIEATAGDRSYDGIDILWRKRF